MRYHSTCSILDPCMEGSMRIHGGARVSGAALVGVGLPPAPVEAVQLSACTSYLGVFGSIPSAPWFSSIPAPLTLTVGAGRCPQVLTSRPHRSRCSLARCLRAPAAQAPTWRFFLPSPGAHPPHPRHTTRDGRRSSSLVGWSLQSGCAKPSFKIDVKA